MHVKQKALENNTISQDEHEELIATNYVQIIAETVQKATQEYSRIP
jgi:hypothetical protein